MARPYTDKYKATATHIGGRLNNGFAPFSIQQIICRTTKNSTKKAIFAARNEEKIIF